MNYYRLLGISVLCTFLILVILSLQFRSEGDVQLVFGFGTGVKYSPKYFITLITIYSIILSGSAFFAGNKAELKVTSFWLYVLSLIIPLTIHTAFTAIPEWTIFQIANYRGRYPQDYYDYINDYGLFNIGMISLNTVGLITYGFQTFRKLSQ